MDGVPAAAGRNPFDLPAGDIFRVQNSPPRMSAFLAKIQFPGAARVFPFGELHPELDQFINARGAFFNNDANDIFMAEASARRLQDNEKLREIREKVGGVVGADVLGGVSMSRSGWGD